MGSAVTAIPVYTTSLPAEVIAPCYVRLYPTPNETLLANFLGSAVAKTHIAAEELMIECASMGSSDLEAENRAAQLLMEVMAQARLSLLSGLVTINRTSLTGSGSYEQCSNYMIEPITPQPPPSGPNKDSSVPMWTATRYARIKVWVTHVLTA